MQHVRLRLFDPRVLLVLPALLVVAACGTETDGEGRPRVVASTALIAELAGRVAGEDAEVVGLIPPGTDLHSYEPPPETARQVARADLLLLNGYFLEEALIDIVIENRRGAPVVAVSRGLTPIAGGDVHDDEHDGEADGAGGSDRDPTAASEVDPLIDAQGNPHFWLDVQHVVRYVENIRDALVDLDPEHADGYRERAGAYIEELRVLDAELRERLALIPSEQRRLVAFHSAYDYFARAYDFELVGTLLPSSPNQEASAGRVAEVIELLRERQVRAIFAEPQFSRDVVEAIGREAGVRVEILHSTLGPDAPDYATFMRRNVETLVDALGEGAAGNG